MTQTQKSQGAPVDGTIYDLLVDENELLWIGTSRQLKTYNLNTKEFSAIAPDKILKNGTDVTTQDFRATKFTKDSANFLWIASNKGLISFDGNGFTHFDQTDGLPSNEIMSVTNNPMGGLWITTIDKIGTYREQKFSSLVEMDNNRGISFLAVSRDNRLFFSASQVLYEIQGNVINKYDLTGVSAGAVKPLIFDKQDNLWLGANDGLIQFRPRQIEVFYAINEVNAKVGTSAMIESEDGTVWIASKRYLLSWKDGIFKTVISPEKNIFSVSLALDKNNSLFIGAENGVYQLKDGKPERVFESAGELITSLFFDRTGKFWFGVRGQGLYSLENGELKKYTTENGLANNWVSFIMQDRAGAIWFGTKGGASRLEDGKFTNYTAQNGLVNENIREIVEDEDGVFWFGTYGGGISRLKDGKIVSITSKNGLAEDIASRILQDNYRIFWVMANKGIYTVSRQSLNDFADGKTKRVYCTIYDERDGMEVGEGSGGNFPAGFKTRDGKLWFPMIRGGIIINPPKPNSVSPPAYIESVMLDKQNVNTSEKLEIQPNQSNLEINYTAISFIKPEQIQFRYKLEGYDTDWQDVGTRRIAYYPYLPPGTYTFRVMATNGNDIWNENDASLEITVYAPFWRTWWFLALCILALILLIVWAYQRRLANVRHKQQMQQDFSRRLINAHESERNRIAGELHDSLGHELLIIKNWALLTIKNFSDAEKAKKQLEDISEAATNALNETRAIARNLRPQYLKKFGLTETLQMMVKQVEESSQIEVQAEIENIDKLFSDEDELSIYRIVQESLNNIVKHSEATRTEIKIVRVSPNIDLTNSQEKVEILISDNGKGFNLKEKSKTSFGLDTLSQRTALLGGTYQIKSSEGKGTKIILSLIISGNRDFSKTV